MSQYTEVLPDGTRRVVKYQRGKKAGPVSNYLSTLKRHKYLQSHPEFAHKGELARLGRKIHNLRRGLNHNRRYVAQSKSSPSSAGTKGRAETNIRNTNRGGFAASPGDGGMTGNGHAFIPDNTAALSLQTGCEVTPQGCLNVAGEQTAVELNNSDLQH